MQILKHRRIALSLVVFLSLAFTFMAIPAQHSLATCSSADPGGPGCNTVSTPANTAPGGDAACQNTDSAGKLNNCLQNSKIVDDLQNIVNFLAAGVGIVVVGMIILGGIQYSIAGDNASAVSAAKGRITNALIALVAFIFMFAFLNWLIPGGAFG